MADALQVAALLKIAAALAGYPEPAGRPLPAVVAMPVAALKARVCPAAADRCGEVAALYDHHAHRILIRADLDRGDAIGQSFLVHELVHVLQAWDHDTDADGCAASLAAERTAYAAQNRFLAQAGRPERFGTMLAMMACAPDQRAAAPGMMQLEIARAPATRARSIADLAAASPPP